MITFRFIAVAILLFATACSSNGPNSSYEELGYRANTDGFGHRYAQPEDTDDLVVGPGDQIGVEVANVPEATARQAILQNGTIEVFQVGRVEVAGLTPAEIENKISILIAPFVKDPTVRVVPLLIRSQNIYVFGRDERGQIQGRRVPITGDMTLVDLMVTAFQGVPAGVDDCNIKVMRADPRHPKQYVINLRDIIVNGYSAANIQMRPNDMVWIPQTFFAKIASTLVEVTRPIQVITRTLRETDDVRFFIEEGEFRGRGGRGGRGF